MDYIIVKTIFNNIVEYGKMFDSETDAIEQMERLNQLAQKDGWNDLVRFSVLPCEVMPKKGKITIEVKAELLGLIVYALQSGSDLSKVSAELAETIGLQLLADIVNQIEK